MKHRQLERSTSAILLVDFMFKNMAHQCREKLVCSIQLELLHFSKLSGLFCIQAKQFTEIVYSLFYVSLQEKRKEKTTDKMTHKPLKLLL